MRFGDSRTDKATSRHDDKGKLGLDLKREKSSTSVIKTLKNLVGMGDDEEEAEDTKRKKGLIASAAGGEEKDNQVHHVAGVRLVKADIEKIVEIAQGDVDRWTHCAALNYDKKTYNQWRDLGKQIAAKGGKDPAWVADELALYVGKDEGKRMNVLMQLVRPAGSAAIGKRSEYPESLKKKHVASYEELVIGDCLAEFEATAKSEGSEVAGKLGRKMFERLVELEGAIKEAQDFVRPGSQAEMLSDITERKTALLGRMRQERRYEVGRRRRRCLASRLRPPAGSGEEVMARLEAPPLASLAQLLGKRERFLSRDLGEVMAGLEKPADLYAIWGRDYEQAAAPGEEGEQARTGVPGRTSRTSSATRNCAGPAANTTDRATSGACRFPFRTCRRRRPSRPSAGSRPSSSAPCCRWPRPCSSP